MRLRVAAAVVFASLSSHGQAQVSSGQIANRQVNGSWESFSIINGNDMRLRATATDGHVTVIADDFIPDCKIDISVTAPISKPMNDTPASHLPGLIRIDDGPLHAITYSTTATVMGDTAVYATVDATPEFTNIIGEMMVGSVARLKIGDASTDPVVSVPLNGFAVSLQRLRSWCKNVQDYLAQPTEDSHRPKKPKRPAPGSSIL